MIIRTMEDIDEKALEELNKKYSKKVLSSIRLAYARCSLRALTRLLNIKQ